MKKSPRKTCVVSWLCVPGALVRLLLSISMPSPGRKDGEEGTVYGTAYTPRDTTPDGDGAPPTPGGVECHLGGISQEYMYSSDLRGPGRAYTRCRCGALRRHPADLPGAEPTRQSTGTSPPAARRGTRGAGGPLC